jgi:hypothetical protein
MKLRPPSSLNRDLRSGSELTSWAKIFCNCKLAITITFGSGRSTATTTPSIRTVEEILRKGLKRLNTLCYKNWVKRKGLSIGAITAIEGRVTFERIHAHIAIEPPPDMTFIHFSRLVDRAFKRSKWIEQRPHVKECWSQDWINYTLKLGQESLVPSCCFAAKHKGA